MQTTNETRRTLRMFFGKRRENANDHNDWLHSLPLPFGNSLWAVKTAVLIGQRFCLVLDLPTLEVVGGCGGWTTTLSYYRFTYPLISGVGSRVMAKEILSHPLSPLFSPLIPSFSGICKVRKKFLLNLSMKCWNSAFNAQGNSRIIIVLVLYR
jgi:hypothetical protein